MWRGARLPARAVKVAMRELQLNSLLLPRRIDISCCGLSKTGTHSLSGIFANYRSRHHPDAKVRLPLCIAFLNEEVGMSEVSTILRDRDRKLWLEMESSTTAGILIEAMLEACPEKRFVLTLRDVYSWCDSWLNHNINRPPKHSSMFAALDRVRLRAERFPPTQHDAPLVDLGFPSLAAYFQLWSSHNAQVLKSVPPEKLFVLKTREITSRMNELACWVGVAPEMLRADRGWLAAAPKKHGVLASMDPSYVEDTAMNFCADLMERFFPDASVERFLNRSQ
jgi:hypothetical protein